LEDLALDMEILQLILKKLSENVWNTLVWLRIWLEFVKVIKTCEFPQVRGIVSSAAILIASHGGVHSTW